MTQSRSTPTTLLGPIELGDRLGVPMPATRAMYACARFLDDARASQRAPRMEVGVR